MKKEIRKSLAHAVLVIDAELDYARKNNDKLADEINAIPVTLWDLIGIDDDEVNESEIIEEHTTKLNNNRKVVELLESQRQPYQHIAQTLVTLLSLMDGLMEDDHFAKELAKQKEALEAKVAKQEKQLEKDIERFSEEIGEA